jgi:hypothetical protein
MRTPASIAGHPIPSHADRLPTLRGSGSLFWAVSGWLGGKMFHEHGVGVEV